MGFRSAVAFYPNCYLLLTNATQKWIPLADSWSSPTVCNQAFVESTKNGQPIALRLFPGATHAFDVVGTNTVYLGHTLRYDSIDTQAAHMTVQEFLLNTLH